MTDPQQLTRTLGGRWYGSYGTAPCPVCQPEHRRDQNALTIAQGQSALVLHCKKSVCDFSDILNAADVPPDHALRPPLTTQRSRSADNAERARQLWERALPICGTRAEAYLEARAISCALPDCLGYLPECWHPSGAKLPAMIALIEGGQGFAVHRTYLARNGLGKAKLDPPKAMLGRASGGAVRLSGGAGSLVVAEGIETALSLLCGVTARPATVWAALSTSGMRGLILPDMPGELIIASDGDAPGQAAAFDLATRAHALGWKVSNLAPPNGLDWNDVLTGKEVAA
ncbi:DUF7146 domain-containing protein [Primorskyibacter marinus]|uniref:DUF7146 domain-containing protein n=1 Tax=Primorskyibacter marinus TaxID=1977320 RepID=UPI000E30185D